MWRAKFFEEPSLFVVVSMRGTMLRKRSKKRSLTANIVERGCGHSLVSTNNKMFVMSGLIPRVAKSETQFLRSL